ncbi:MAG: prealbumin-like fold domain-containing protein, partial [Patescibacteria group bacterium]|nr:prealbumin-like fold domain-containing protein [Patescibacteria group bacterium]
GPTGPGAASEHATDNNGEILLSDLDPGTYRAEEQVPSGFNPTTQTVQQADVTDDGTAVLKFGNQRFQKKVVPKPVPPQAQVKGALPVTGAPSAAMLALSAIAGSTYLYRRERNALKKTIRNRSVKG